jgi:2-phospho-L-lactate guanylyltransferase
MQATVLRFEQDGSGTVLFDDGERAAFARDAFARSGLRLLRPGQRVRLRRAEDGRIEALTIITLPEPD